MIGSHPGGTALTRRLLDLAGIQPPGNVLDLGAGNGETVRFLRERGYMTFGIDLEPGVKGVERQDMIHLSFPEDSFDLCMAECSISVCSDGRKALSEAYRVLKPGGDLLVSDIFFHKEDAPFFSMGESLTWNCWEKAFTGMGFQICAMTDETSLWREFFLESLWNGNADAACLGFFKEAGRAGCGYFLAWLRKGREHGFI